MTTWLMDTALFATIATPKAAGLQKWLDANEASVFLSAASLTEIAAGIEKAPASQPQRGEAQRKWFGDLTSRYADRIHQVDAEVALRAGSLMRSVQNGLPRHRLHDALLVATAQAHGHGLLTRRDGVFGAWTKVPISMF